MSIRASWSGGRGLIAWRVFAGVSRTGLSAIATASAHGARAVIRVPNGSPYFAVQALGSRGRVLATSKATAAPAHLAVFGRAASVSLTGTGGIPAGGYASSTCHIASTVHVGGVVVARTGTESIHAGSTGILYFTLGTTGLFMLANSRGGQLPVQVDLRDTAGTAATVSLSLIGFATTGPAPARGVRQAPPSPSSWAPPIHAPAGPGRDPRGVRIARSVPYRGDGLDTRGHGRPDPGPRRSAARRRGMCSSRCRVARAGCSPRIRATTWRPAWRWRPAPAFARNDRAGRLSSSGASAPRLGEPENQLRGLRRHVAAAVADAVEHHPSAFGSHSSR